VSGARPPLSWEPDGLHIEGTRFLVSDNAEEYLANESSLDGIVVAKSREMVEDLLASVADGRTDRIVDVGIYKGGSTALLAAALRPLRLTAFDVAPEPVEVLEDFVAAHDWAEVVHSHYGVDQADLPALLALIEKDHGGEPLDLVVDDASHFYRETRATFSALFPLLRPGGVYVIEDWAWAHYSEPLWQEHGGWFHDRPALTNLIVEVLMMLGSGSKNGANGVAKVTAQRGSVQVVRGPAPLSSPMRIEEQYRNRGLPFRPLM
jgi:predicted O-methyltransferase YrrM